jgi:oxaloacetate decarboxylase beta subunit
MVNERKSIMINITLKIVIIFILIGINYLISKYINVNNSASAVAIIGGADGPTTIYISSKYSLINILRYSLSILFLINIIALLVYDVIGLKKAIKYSIKYKLKIIIAMDLFIILSVIIQIIINILLPTLSIFLNIILLSVLSIIIYFIKIKNRKKLRD